MTYIPILNFVIPQRVANAIIVVMTLTVLVLAYLLLFVPTPAKHASGILGTLITVSEPFEKVVVGNSFTVRGSARGSWYFEASFPLEVRDQRGRVVGHGIAQAQGDWMTEALVPFVAQVSVASYHGPATLILRKDNPSGLPEHDASVSIPITVR